MKRFISVIISCFILISLFGVYGCSEKNTTKEDNSEKSTITLSKNDIVIGLNETFLLYAVVSPDSNQKVNWLSKNTSIATVDQNGEVKGIAVGETSIQVSISSGEVAFCSVKVEKKVGSISGNVSYKYNDYIGNKPDTGATILLILKSINSLPDSVGLGMTYELPEGCYSTTVDGTGNYIINDVAVGNYYIVMISKHTNENPSRVLLPWGSVYYKFSAKGMEYADLTAKCYKIYDSTVEISNGRTTTLSHDFGVTYI